MARNHVRTNDPYAKQFLSKFEKLCYARSGWQVWIDFVSATACALANTFDKDSPHYQEREKEYEQCAERLGGTDNAAELFSYVVLAMEENPEQDFLGDLYMNLELSNHWKGQFFTPYHLCEAMARMTIGDAIDEVNSRGWASVNDPACGAGAIMIAAANHMKAVNIDYQNHVLFVGQDIDRVAGLMCFIQLSLLGCAGYVVIGNTLTDPIVGNSVLFPHETEGQEIWYLPMYFNDVWDGRRRVNLMDMFLRGLGG